MGVIRTITQRVVRLVSSLAVGVLVAGTLMFGALWIAEDRVPKGGTYTLRLLWVPIVSAERTDDGKTSSSLRAGAQLLGALIVGVSGVAGWVQTKPPQCDHQV